VRDRLISVAVPVPALGLLTYSIPGGVPLPPIGARVVVPVGPRTLTGVVLGEVAAADTAYTIKPIKSLVSGSRTITWPVPAPRCQPRSRRRDSRPKRIDLRPCASPR
jgi:primosomal protein N'